MKIAIIGIGRVGAIVGERWAGLGHPVVFAVRDPKAPKVAAVLSTAGPNAKAATVAEAAEDSDVVVLATPFGAAEAAIKAAGGLAGKIVIDCVNPLDARIETLTVGTTDSAAEQIARWAPKAKIVKALNMTGSPNMADPAYPEGRASMFICGDDKAAKDTVGKLVAELGFEVEDAGPLSTARVLEPMALLWIKLALKFGYGSNIAFRLMRR